MLNNNFFYTQVAFDGIYICRKFSFCFIRIFFTRIFFFRISFIRIFLHLNFFWQSSVIRIFFIRSRRNLCIIGSIIMNLFFFNNIFTFLWKHLRIIVLTRSKNRINWNYWWTIQCCFSESCCLEICVCFSIIWFYFSSQVFFYCIPDYYQILFW